MRASLHKARAALLTDPATGLPLARGTVVRGGIGLVQALILILLLIGGALGMTP